MKIGIFAGTFDPIHDGHIAFAQHAVQEAKLDKVIIVAEKEPYRKKPFAAWDHRQAMIERATEKVESVDHDYHFASDLAKKHTMQKLLEVAKKHYGDENEFWFLVGSDIFEHMHRWEELTHSSQYGGFVVALRDNHTQEWLKQKKVQLAKSHFDTHIIEVQNHKPHVSSSKIRTMFRKNEVPSGISQNVEVYAKEHGLYLKNK